ncbi:MAG: Gfo/Idh/MocA family oxidoreductase [Bacteroidales bacterium]|nr:MAG: Gfo/Idh/MocA family oxidoreductase [Bacteroidales bacterium]
MKTKNKVLSRRNFIAATGTALAGTLVTNPAAAVILPRKTPAKKKLALVGTGIRGTTFWGKRILDNYADLVDFVGLCDINPGRLEFAKSFIGASCPTFTNFEEMMNSTKPDMLIVTTVDATHDEFIVKGLEMGADVLTEKPMTTDDLKCRKILDTERSTGRKVIVGFNYRYGPHSTKIKELLTTGDIGKITSVDFHWYLNIYHGASYFRRWHGIRSRSGTLLVHKATHHFDLLNWWLDSDPVEVFAYGDLEHYGANNSFRGDKCRSCPYKEKCKFFWDITTDKMLMNLYVNHEHHDGYIRDNCLWRNEIDIYDKMAVQIKYANNVQVSYSLTTYSPYEGWRITFNGFNGRLESWLDIPWRKDEIISQAELHAKEMEQEKQEVITDYEEIIQMKNFENYQMIKLPRGRGGHGGGDQRLQDQIFRNPDMPDPYRHAAGSRDGAMSILIGIAARKSIESGEPVRIADLTDIKPEAVRPAKS